MVAPSDFAAAWMSGALTIASKPAAVLARLPTSCSTGRAATLFMIAVADACSASIVAGTEGMTGTGPLVSSSAGGASAAKVRSTNSSPVSRLPVCSWARRPRLTSSAMPRCSVVAISAAVKPPGTSRCGSMSMRTGMRILSVARS